MGLWYAQYTTNAHRFHEYWYRGFLQSNDNLFCVLRVTFIRAIGAFEATAFGMSAQTLVGDDVATRHHHWRVLIGCLLLGYGTYKDRMKLVGWWKGYLNLLDTISKETKRESHWWFGVMTYRKFVLGSPFGTLLLHYCL